MKIVFLSISGCCDYNNIGGAESVVRRLATGLATLGHDIEYLIYRADYLGTERVSDRISVRYCTGIGDVFEYINDQCDHVITIQIKPIDRIRYFFFQISSKARFHKLMLGTPKSPVRWIVFLGEILLNTLRGKVLTISSNTFRVLKKRGFKVRLLPPPVNRSCFSIVSKTSKPLKLLYLGRLDSEKGIDQVLDLFNYYKEDERVNTRVEGYYWDDGRAKLVLESHDGDVITRSIIKAASLKYSVENERKIVQLLHDTDILLLPYKSMIGTIDPPLLLLEAMAAGCVCMTTNTGNVVTVYGDSEFVLDCKGYGDSAKCLINKILINPDILKAERKRLNRRLPLISDELKAAGDLIEALVS